MDTGAFLGAAATVIAALIALAGSWWVYRKTKALRDEQADVEQRKVDIDAFNTFREAQNNRITDLERRLEKSNAEATRTRGLLRHCVLYIQTLKTVMRQNQIVAPPTPDELATIPWDTLDLE